MNSIFEVNNPLTLEHYIEHFGTPKNQTHAILSLACLSPQKVLGSGNAFPNGIKELNYGPFPSNNYSKTSNYSYL